MSINREFYTKQEKYNFQGQKGENYSSGLKHGVKVFVEFKRKKQDCLQFSICYQDTKLFGGYFSHPNEFVLSWIEN
jgi:hypothetical protein